MRQIFRQLCQTYSNRSIIAVLGSAVFLASAMGLTSALWVYFMSFYFGLSSAQLSLVQIVYLGAAITTVVFLPRLSRNRDKKSLAMTVALLFWLVDVAPYALRTVGLLPDNGSSSLLPVLLVYAFFDGVLINMLMALVLSMLTDVVEDNLLKTGRREEGVVLAGQTLVNKSSTAIGTFFGGLLLGIVQFPQAAGITEVPGDILWRLGFWYWMAMWSLGALSLLFLRSYLIHRRDHSSAVAALTIAGKL
jgi:Na+/melibiose symporter-like transporter